MDKEGTPPHQERQSELATRLDIALMQFGLPYQFNHDVVTITGESPVTGRLTASYIDAVPDWATINFTALSEGAVERPVYGYHYSRTDTGYEVFELVNHARYPEPQRCRLAILPQSFVEFLEAASSGSTIKSIRVAEGYPPVSRRQLVAQWLVEHTHQFWVGLLLWSNQVLGHPQYTHDPQSSDQ